MKLIKADVVGTQRLMIIPHILKQAKTNKFATRSCRYLKLLLNHINKTPASSNQLADSFFFSYK